MVLDRRLPRAGGARPDRRCSPPATRSLATELAATRGRRVAALEAIPAPFDQHLARRRARRRPGPRQHPGRHRGARGPGRPRSSRRPTRSASPSRSADMPACVASARLAWRSWSSLASCVRGDGGVTRSTADLGGDTTRELTLPQRLRVPGPEPQRRANGGCFEIGDSFFTKNWVTAPASTDARDGLGPTFNAPGLLVVPRPRRPRRPARPDRSGRSASGCCCGSSVPGETPTGAPAGPRLRWPAAGPVAARRARGGTGRRRATRRSTGSYADGTPYTLHRADVLASPIPPSARSATT